MTTSDRLLLAQKKIQWMVDDLIDLLALHENNALITYSPLLSGQIPRSHAANAFNVVQEGIHRYEIIRICTFWDGVDLDKANIPTVAELVDDKTVARLVARRTEDHWANGQPPRADRHPDPDVQAAIEAAYQKSERVFGRQQAAQTLRGLKSTIAATRKINASPMLASVKNTRHKLAHRLSRTRADKSPGIVHAMKYGDEKSLLEQTISVIDGLNLSVNGASFAWGSSRRIAKKNALALWERCSFDIRY